MTITAQLDSAAAYYSETKFAIERVTGAGQDLMHVHAGLLIFVVSALLFRKRMRSPVPLAFVAVFAFLNEFVDWWGGKPIDTGEPIIDALNTLFWPAILFALARRWR